MSLATRSLPLASEAETVALAQFCARHSRAGDTYLLEGDIGAGKSTFARAFVRAWLGSPAEDVPSPTFTIVQTYEDAAGDVWHCDLYRLTSVDELAELGLDDAFETAICLIEWPDRLGTLAPSGAIHFAMAAGDDGHRVVISAPDATLRRVLGPDV
jgi:tRNA threonylcarbamoyladenosine biosynthesis protein TsaE